jgi:hypothetical protein
MFKRIIWITIILTLLQPASLIAADKKKKNKRKNKKAEEERVVQYYEASFDGLTDYMKDLKKTNRKVFKKLLPDYKKLRSMRKKATWTSLSVALLGGAVSAYGFYNDKEVIETSSLTGARIKRYEMNETYIYSGLAILSLAGSSWWIFGPTARDYRNFLNKHNRLNKKSPLEFTLEWDIDPIVNKYAALKFNLSF